MTTLSHRMDQLTQAIVTLTQVLTPPPETDTRRRIPETQVVSFDPVKSELTSQLLENAPPGLEGRELDEWIESELEKVTVDETYS